jgi:hypothetical protein
MILNALSHHYYSEVEVGASYRRYGAGAVIETAQVIDVAPDKMGIPHVRYQLNVARRGAVKPFVESRTLSLEAFQARYKERLKN